MKRYKCTNCNHILEVEEEKDKTIFGKMLKMGGWLVAGAVALHFLVGPAKFNFRPSTAFCCPVGAAETA